MAQKVQVLLVDDIDGGEADETVSFALDGKNYQIDLSDRNAQKLRKSLAEFVKAGRKAGSRAGGRGKARKARPAASEDTAEIRAWAKKKGYDISERGRIPAEIREAYQKAAR
ncbi:Lsr2 family protein [Nocardiopsis gilva YIM 90087]|uniref:Lsr2 family protein n=1 Tax=Nocardiopsis gilva YIM 90087 TaxID=1235441 RepID=A0A223S3B0_9ACTN|nr:Lsr2 family protein [Nocardiopsis gilva]ASU82614.1 Lsr2 family protein [Nocardiopsis gilva YIM 90087]